MAGARWDTASLAPVDPNPPLSGVALLDSPVSRKASLGWPLSIRRTDDAISRADLSTATRARASCGARRPDGVPRRAAAAWLIAEPTIVVLNAHNFRSRRLETTRQVSDCYFQIAGRNYEFVPDSLQLGTAPGATALHITDDWAILRLATPTDVTPQPLPPPPPGLPTGDVSLSVTMVSPAGHENYGARAAWSTAPSVASIPRARTASVASVTTATTVMADLDRGCSTKAAG